MTTETTTKQGFSGRVHVIYSARGERNPLYTPCGYLIYRAGRIVATEQRVPDGDRAPITEALAAGKVYGQHAGWSWQVWARG